jgi:hypothetical protein
VFGKMERKEIMSKLRMAEHMLLEAKVHGLVPYTRCDDGDNRCALGLVKTGDECAEEVYPWLGQAPGVAFPCECNPPKVNSILCGALSLEYYDSISAFIVHLFNEHVMQGGKCNPGAAPWTMERLADWSDSVDPTPREPQESSPCEAEQSDTIQVGGHDEVSRSR